jgi:hypothetical protein
MNKSTSPGSRKRNSSSSKQSSTPPKANKKGYGSPSNETSPKTNAPTTETATAEAPTATTSPLPTLLQIEAERLTRDLPAFVRAAWPILEPVTPLLWNWHLDLICDYLTLIKEARFKDVCGAHCEGIIFNVPPRTMKSLLITVMFPAWLWTSDPARRWMFASYAEKLSTQHSVYRRNIMRSPWYQERWGHVVRFSRDQNQKTQYENTARGSMLATAMGALATGFGGDVLVFDDPLVEWI